MWRWKEAGGGCGGEGWMLRGRGMCEGVMWGSGVGVV